MVLPWLYHGDTMVIPCDNGPMAHIETQAPQHPLQGTGANAGGQTGAARTPMGRSHVAQDLESQRPLATWWIRAKRVSWELN